MNRTPHTFSSTSIKRNTLINLTSAVIPIFVSLVTVPPYLKIIGNARYGILAIVWVLLAYFGLFDLGLGRAIANHVAKVRNSSAYELQSIFWTALLVNTLLGLLGGLIFLFFGHFLLGTIFKMPPELRPEVLASLPWLAALVPLTTVSSILNGMLEGQERFFVVNSLGVTATTLCQVIPLAVAIWYGPDLVWLFGSIVLVRFAISIFTFLLCHKYLELTNRPIVNLAHAKSLLTYGTWITVTNIISPILSTLDRLIIGVQIGVQSLTYYSIGQNLVSQTTILPGSLSRTLFPRFSMLKGEEARSVSQQATLALAAVLTPFTVFAFVMLYPFLRLWLGSDLATSSAPVAEIVFIGFWFNSMAFIPFTYLQGQGKPDITAKFHAIELLPYLAFLWIGLITMGINGAAWAWTLRVTADSALVFWGAHTPRRQLIPLIFPAVIILLTGAGALTLFNQPILRIGLGGLAVLLTTLWSMKVLFWDLHLLDFNSLRWWEILHFRFVRER